MTPKTQQTVRISEHILEVRYKPNSKVLDYRGTWAETISELMGLPHWKIDANRIEVFDKAESESLKAFVSFKNCGLVVQDSSTRSFFPDQAVKLLKFLFQQKGFGTSVHVTRIGVRSRFAISCELPIDDLVKRYTERVFVPAPQISEIIGGSIIDVGAALNFSTQHGKVNTAGGPMEEKQLKEVFPSRKEVPEVALYIDLDYYKEPDTKLTIAELSSSVKHYAEDAWIAYEKLVELILS